MKSTSVEFLKKLPSRNQICETLESKPEKFLLIYDKRLMRMDAASRWIGEFALTYAVDGGERLKDVADLPYHLEKIWKLVGPFSSRSLAVVAFGGGTVGDFAGFLASVFKRGVPLVHVPSTWLAAMDSSHGGKNGLNLRGAKNQIGTFYPADAVVIARSVLETLPPIQLQSAAGELTKMAILSGGELATRFRSQFRLDMDSLWDFLPATIKAKMDVVAQDPTERTGQRQILNLGHTLGHALEVYFGLAHGVAVAQGLVFAMHWSQHQGYLRAAVAQDLVNLIKEKTGALEPREFARTHKFMSRSKLMKYLVQDKKLTDTRHLNFVFVEGEGRPLRKVVTIDSFLTETQRQGWTAV